MQKPKLISFKLCPFVQRSVIVLKEKKVEYDIEYIDLANKPDWFLKISPLGKVPVLQIDGEVLFESAVIMEFLDETNPPSLHPSNPIQKAKHRAWIEFVSSLFIDQYQVTMTKSEEEFQKKLVDIKNKYKILEAAITKSKSLDQFFAGDQFHLVDAAIAPYFMRNAFLSEKFPEWFSLTMESPMLKQWSASLLAKESVQTSVLPEVPSAYIQYIKDHHSYLGGRLSA
ncbi:glutathione transferase [Leptospira ryugenii]|uniref:glutathione transferase n=1 Tax=Leptospira ryugenii TaxID=1917863 RepID=A0A2P2DWC1_9LEPT|nr:glutathione S-transferase family protein [Leptospira ryugenii]GBF48939.1 glutathione transferase [Leptospira ryugenii]